MTEAATRFVAPLTFETLSKNAVATDLFSRERPWEVEHIALAQKADLAIVAPASANTIAKLACGLADRYADHNAARMHLPDIDRTCDEYGDAA